MEPNLHFGLRDAAYALGYSPNQNVGTHRLRHGHFQKSLEAPKHPSNPRPIRPETMLPLVVPPLFNRLYASFSTLRYGFYALLLQTHSGIGQYALSPPHCQHVSSHFEMLEMWPILMVF